MASSNELYVEDLARLLDLPSLDDILELNQEYLFSYYQHGLEEARAEGLALEDAEEQAEEAQWEGEKELLEQWSSALEAAAASVFEPHGLEVEDRGKGVYRLVPEKGWKDVAAHLVNTINGVGMFYYEDAKDLKDVGPYKSYKEAVLSHLHWMTRYSDVYGTPSPEQVYNRNWR